ncbi:MAG: hypothetical protein H7Y59_17240 [Anaerolineales bacterium]|nr:hypothetical protein [Anaerolineales bacterium]
MAEPMYFQWQNEFLCKTIYPMRDVKLRDFLAYYKEVDLWAEYKNKDISTLKADVEAYESGLETARITEFKKYTSLRGYFMNPDVRGSYVKYKPIEENALAEIHKIHAIFISSWPKDIRGERSFILMRIDSLKTQIGFLKDRVKYLQRRLESMVAGHPSRPKDEEELRLKNNSVLPMLFDEMEKLRDFEETYDKLEQPKLEWYKLSKGDPKFEPSEQEYVIDSHLKAPVTVNQIVRLKVEQYTKTLEGKSQYQLLEEIRQRFEKEPKRFPLWLQYMVVHFSGMRYKSAHGSWADPKDLLVELRLKDVQKEQLALTDAEVDTRAKEKISQYESTGANKPKLATASDKKWKDKIALHMQGVKANGPKTKRAGLAALAAEEARYEFMSLTTDQALAKLEAMKSQFPAWAWKTIVRLTQLRVNYVNDEAWETLTPEEEKERGADRVYGKIINDWAVKHTGSWRDEHGRTHEVIVSRAVCNETAEHVQHIRGNLPPGGLTDNAARYFKLFAAKTPAVKFVRPTTATDYIPGASIFWLRFVNNEPSVWQVAKGVEDANGVGLLSKDFIGKRQQLKGKKNEPPPPVPWQYKMGEPITRTRTMIDANKVRSNQTQWLRWIHEATVAEVAETADGTYVYTFETSLPNDDRGTSCLGVFRNTLRWNLDDGTEDNYNRSFVGFTPEGQVPTEHIKEMLDWKKIILK